MHTMDFSKATPELLNAFCRAQERGGTVGKDREAQQRGYVSGERMIQEAQACLDKLGISLLTPSWTILPATATSGALGQGQYVSGLVRLAWALVGHGGVITGVCEMHAVASPSRPTEKAEASTLTYMMGYLVRGLFLLARGERDEYDVSRRDDRDAHERQQDERNQQPQQQETRDEAPPRAAKTSRKPAAAREQQVRPPAAPPPAPPVSKPAAASLPDTSPEANAARQRAGEVQRAYKKACGFRGLAPRSYDEVVLDATGRPRDEHQPWSANEWRLIGDEYAHLLDSLPPVTGGGGNGFDPPEAAR